MSSLEATCIKLLQKYPDNLLDLHVWWEFIEVDPFVLLHCLRVIDADLLIGVHRYNHRANVCLYDCMCVQCIRIIIFILCAGEGDVKIA